MRTTVGRVLLGFLAGYLLSRLRAMPGGDAVDWAGVEASTAGAWRGSALIILALSALGARAGGTWIVLGSVALGYAFHGFGFGPSHGVPWLVLALALVAVIVGRVLVLATAEDVEEEGAQPTSRGEDVGLLLAGAGLALSLESIARHVRLFGDGLAQDDTVIGTVFLLLLAFGAAAFGWIVCARATRRLSFPVCLAASASACVLSVMFLDTVADGRGLRPFLERWHVAVADLGTPAWDGLFAAAAFVAPALLLGAGLAGARGRGSWTSALLGAAVTMLVLPRFLDQGHDDETNRAELFSSQMVPIGVLITGIGAALAALSEKKRKPVARYVTLILIGLCVTPALLRSIKPLPILSPWEPRMIMPFVTFERGTGLSTVEPSIRGFKVATLDRNLLTPDVDGLSADTQRIADSFALMRARKPDARVLFVGQLTPLRAAALSVQGAGEIDRTASWWRSMPRLEDGMFRVEDKSSPTQLPSGRVLSPREARKRLESGAYDLVIAMPIEGDAPAIRASEAPASTTVVRWLAPEVPLAGVMNPAESRLEGSDLEHAVVLSADGLDVPSIAVVENGVLAEIGDPRRVRVLAFDRDREVETPWTRVHRLAGLRANAARASTFAAIAHTRPGPLADGLARFYAIQAASPPFEQGLTRVELDDPTLEALARAAEEGPLDPFLRSAWSWIARVLTAKRDVTAIDRFLAPLAAAHGPWTELEIALAYADLEGLDAPAAVRRLEPIVARESSNLRAWFALGEALELVHDAPGAAAAYRQASRLAPDQRSLRRRLAMALVWAGDPEGKKLVSDLLSTDLNDPELHAFHGPGEPPPMPNAFVPASARALDAH